MDEGDEPGQAELAKGAVADLLGSLRGQPAPPGRAAQAPADLDLARAVVDQGQADEACELTARPLLGRPQAEAVADPVTADPRQRGLGLGAVQRLAAADEAHDQRIGAQGGEGLDVAVAPAAQRQPLAHAWWLAGRSIS